MSAKKILVVNVLLVAVSVACALSSRNSAQTTSTLVRESQQRQDDLAGWQIINLTTARVLDRKNLFYSVRIGPTEFRGVSDTAIRPVLDKMATASNRQDAQIAAEALSMAQGLQAKSDREPDRWAESWTERLFASIRPI